MGRIDKVYELLRSECNKSGDFTGLSAKYIAEKLGYSRCNVSNDLNRLYEQGKVQKVKGRPVLYIPCDTCEYSDNRYKDRHQKVYECPDFEQSQYTIDYSEDVFNQLIGSSGSLSNEIEKAKAAVLYPPFGLTTMILGPTGVGKTMFANLMYKYAIKMGVIKKSAQFVTFNCADYANNPQLIMAQLFGYIKGSFTGADKDKEGLVEKANGGFLFLDEVHRLPHEAQEMLFYLMDNGSFRRLGEVENTRKSNPFIVLATTEDPKSVLLKTFQRRIPVIINLPSLKERGLVERLNLIEQLLRLEAAQLKVPVYINSTVVKAFLSYDCPGNIGQLKSDLKLACARAYMAFVTGKHKSMTITIDDVPTYVKEGLIKAKDKYSEVNVISCDLEVKPDLNDGKKVKGSSSVSVYDVIEQKFNEYIHNGFETSKIENCLTNDIENFYNNLLSKYKMNKDFRREELLKIVSGETLQILKNALELIEKETGIKIGFDYSGAFALHINSAIERIRSGKQIRNPNLKSIKNKYPCLYDLALKILNIMKEISGLDFPEDEAGFIAKLINSIINKNSQKAGVRIIVIAHGEGSAKSMASVANKLLGEELVKWYDMSLDEDPEKSLDEVTRLVVQTDMKRGVLLLVDMGSLLSFGDIISCRTGIAVRTINMVSTPMVIEAAHMSRDPDLSLDQIYKRLLESDRYTFKQNIVNTGINYLPKVIITVCITGQGTAIKLKEIIEKRFDFHSYVKTVALDVKSFNEFDYKVKEIASKKEIVCVVGVSRPNAISVPFISIDEMLFGEGFKRLGNLLRKYGVTERDNEQRSNKVINISSRNVELRLVTEALDNYLNFLDGKKLVPNVLSTIEKIEKLLGMKMNRGNFVTLLIHLCCMVERLIFDKTLNEDKAKRVNSGRLELINNIKESISELEKAYNIKVPHTELLYIHDIVAHKYSKE